MSERQREDHPSLPGILADGATIRDSAKSWPVSRTESRHESGYVSLSLDTIVDPEGDEHLRAVVKPHGAVGVLALDNQDRVLLVEQYRHPVRHRLLELPAGTLDVDGESAIDAAARELAEEADVVAERWEPLLNLFATPGYSTEAWHVFIATGLSPVPDADRTQRVAEEADMTQLWIPFEQAVDAVLDGRISDTMTVASILAAQVLRSR